MSFQSKLSDDPTRLLLECIINVDFLQGVLHQAKCCLNLVIIPIFSRINWAWALEKHSLRSNKRRGLEATLTNQKKSIQNTTKDIMISWTNFVRRLPG